MRQAWREKRSKYRKKIPQICLLSLLLALALCPLTVQAAEGDITFTITGLQEQDRLHVYALSRDGEWVNSIEKWLQTDEGKDLYAGFLKQGPSVLGHLSKENAGRFLQAIIQVMKKEDGSFSLEALDVTYSSEDDQVVVSAELQEGFYLAVAEGKRRIYAPVLLHADEEQQDYAYVKEDWSKPKLTQTLTKNGETVTGSSLTVNNNDQLELSLEVKQGSYPKGYSTDKRICSVSQVYESGVICTRGALRLTGDNGRELIIDADYTVNFTEDATVYRFGERTDALAAFYRLGDWYYFMNGAVVVGELAGQELAQVVERYNSVYHTSWTPEDVQETEHCSVLYIALDTWEEELTVNCGLEAGGWNIGAYDTRLESMVESQYLYSVSPLSVDALGVLDKRATLDSRGLRITLYGNGISGSPDSGAGDLTASAGAIIMSGAVFELYIKAGTINDSPSDTTIQNFVEEHGGGRYQVIWNDTSANIYLSVSTIEQDENGRACIGGLEENEYLVIQSVYPDGYAISKVGLLLTAADWTERPIKDVEWWDYKGVYLPETGGRGTVLFMVVGIALMVLALLVVVILMRRRNAQYDEYEDDDEYDDDEYEDDEDDDEDEEDDDDEEDADNDEEDAADNDNNKDDKQ